MIDNYEDVTISINYDEIERAKKYASNASTESSGLSKSLDIKTVTPLNHLPGKDSDYVSGAIESLGAKIQELNSKSEKYKTLSNDLGGLLESIKEHENEVIRKIDVLSTGVFPRNEHVYESESIGSLLYLFFSEEKCESIMANIDEFFNPVTGFFDDTNDAFNQAKDFFKHGEGRYQLDIFMDNVMVFGSIIGTVCAAALAVTAGGVPLTIAAVASGIGTIFTIHNSNRSIQGKKEAKKFIKIPETCLWLVSMETLVDIVNLFLKSIMEMLMITRQWKIMQKCMIMHACLQKQHPLFRAEWGKWALKKPKQLLMVSRKSMLFMMVN